MKKNFFEIKNKLESAQAQLKNATEKVEKAYEDGAEVKDIEKLEGIVDKYKKTVDHYQKELDDLDAENKAKLQAQDEAQQLAAAQAQNKVDEAKAKTIKNKATAIRNTLEGNKAAAKEALKATNGSYRFGRVTNALSDNPTTGNGGSALIPKTTSSDIVTEPVYENDLRPYIKTTYESNLEVPRLLFSIDDDDFVADEATAKELKAKGDTVAFGRYKSKLKAKVSETVLLGSDANLVDTVDSALAGAEAFKEVKQLFAKPSDTFYVDHQSFYATDGATPTPNTLIATVKGKTMFAAIKKAITKLPKTFRKNAKIIMAQSDYFDMLTDLANGNASFFLAPPESILGKPVIFMDEAEGKPIVGDLNYLQANYHPQTIYDQDKDIDSGINMFVLTEWLDIQFLLRSAFKLVEVDTTAGN